MHAHHTSESIEPDHQSQRTLTRRKAMTALAASGAALASGAAGVATDDDAPIEPSAVDAAAITGREKGWRALGERDFVNVNCHDDTWTWSGDGVHCTGHPVGVIRSTKPFTNLEFTCQWRHLRDAGNSGIFLWSPLETLDRLSGPGLPEGIECQVLDLGYTDAYVKGGHGTPNWFTCHGDVFPVGKSTMKPFAPTAPNGRRSFPSANHTRDTGQWNHYYIRAINGEVRLWVNGHEVSGGNDCEPRTGYLCLESEGSPIDFRNLRIRELP